MKITIVILFGLLVMAGFCHAEPVVTAPSPREAGEESKTLALPKAAADAIKAAFSGWVLGDVEMEEEKKVNLYRVDLSKDDSDRAVLASAEGVIVKIYTGILMKDVPKPAADLIIRAAQGANVSEINKVERRATADGKKLPAPVITYEITLKRPGETAEMEVTADGAPVIEWEKDGK